MPNIASDVVNLIDETSLATVSTAYEGFQTGVLPTLSGVIVLSIVIFGYAWMMGLVEAPAKEMLKKLGVFVFAIVLVTSWPIFQTFFYNSFTEGPQELGGIIIRASGSTGTGTVISQLGDLIDKGFAATSRVYGMGGIFMKFILGGFMFLAVLLATGYALALICIAKIGTACVLALGPLFIIFTFFGATRNMFSSWLQQLFNFSFMSVLTYIVVGFFMRLLEASINYIPQNDIGFADVVVSIIVCLVSFIVLCQVPAIASGLAGGAQLTTMGAFSSMARAATRYSWRQDVRDGLFVKKKLNEWSTRRNRIRGGGQG